MATSGTPHQQQPNTGADQATEDRTIVVAANGGANRQAPWSVLREWMHTALGQPSCELPHTVDERLAVYAKLRMAGVKEKFKDYLLKTAQSKRATLESMEIIRNWVPNMDSSVTPFFDDDSLRQILRGFVKGVNDNDLCTPWPVLNVLEWLLTTWPKRVCAMLVHDDRHCNVFRQVAAQQFAHFVARNVEAERQGKATTEAASNVFAAVQTNFDQRQKDAFGSAWYQLDFDWTGGTASDARTAPACALVEQARRSFWRYAGLLLEDEAFPAHLRNSRVIADARTLVRLARAGNLTGTASQRLEALADCLQRRYDVVNEKPLRHDASKQDIQDVKRRLARLRKAIGFLKAPPPKTLREFELGIAIAHDSATDTARALLGPASASAVVAAIRPPQATDGTAPLALPPPSAPDLLGAWLAERVIPRRGCAKCEVAREPEDSVRTGFAKDGGTGKNSDPSKKRACPRFDHAISAQDGVALIAKYESENRVKNIPNKKQTLVAFMKEKYDVEPLGPSPSHKVTLYEAPCTHVQVGVAPAAGGNVALGLTVVGKKRLRPVDKDGEVYEGEDANKIPAHYDMFMGFEIMEG